MINLLLIVCTFDDGENFIDNLITIINFTYFFFKLNFAVIIIFFLIFRSEPSKKALKKQQKEAEKAAKKAERQSQTVRIYFTLY